MIYSTGNLHYKYRDYVNPGVKIETEVKRGNLFPIVHGLYSDDPHVDPFCLAPYIYGPSYISFETALSFHGLIPERTYRIFSATCLKRRTKEYLTPFGAFYYKDIPAEAFLCGLEDMEANGIPYKMASPGKALLDKLYTLRGVGSLKQLKLLLFEDLRIDEDDFENLDKAKLIAYASHYKSQNANLLIKWLKEGGRSE